MKISKEEIIHVSKLARLNPDGKVIDKLAGQVGKILEYIDKLEQADTEGVEPTTHAITLVNALRKDSVHEHLGAEKILANAPEQEDDCFVVPKIVG